MAGDQAYTAGKYAVEILPNNKIKISGGGKDAAMIVLTRVGRQNPVEDLELVFDKVGDKYLLSEVWYLGEDGYLVLATEQAHGQVIFHGVKPKKMTC